MWPFKNAREEMLRRELEEHRSYREAQQASARILEERINDNQNALVTMTVKRDILAMQVRKQREEISRLNTVLFLASKNDSPKDVKTGKFTKKATNV
jgi:hypothetical protein